MKAFPRSPGDLKLNTNTEAIIEKLLQIQDEQILNTPLGDLNLSTRVYRSLWRSRVRTVGDVAEIWNRNRKVSNIGERARCEILGALQAWCLSFPNLTNPATAETWRDAAGCEPDRRLPIEALHLSPRTYRALKRNQIDTLDDIYRDWDKIASIRNVGPATMSEIQKALHPSGDVGSFANPDTIGLTTDLTRETAQLAVDRTDPHRESHPAKSDFADRSTADAAGCEPVHEILTKNYVITEGGFVVSADLLQAEEPRRPREERWRNVSPKQQDYAPKNTFEAINREQNKISNPIQKWKKSLDVSERKHINLLRPLLETLEKANRPRKVRTVTCPLCRGVMRSIRFEQHLVDLHPEEFRELQKTVSSSAGWQNVQGVGLVFRDPLQENQSVKCPLCEHTTRYKAVQDHLREGHPEVDSGLMMKRFSRANRSKDYESLLMYQAELNEMVREYKRLKQGQD